MERVVVPVPDGNRELTVVSPVTSHVVAVIPVVVLGLWHHHNDFFNLKTDASTDALKSMVAETRPFDNAQHPVLNICHGCLRQVPDRLIGAIDSAVVEAHSG